MAQILSLEFLNNKDFSQKNKNMTFFTAHSFLIIKVGNTIFSRINIKIVKIQRSGAISKLTYTHETWEKQESIEDRRINKKNTLTLW